MCSCIVEFIKYLFISQENEINCDAFYHVFRNEFNNVNNT